MKPRKVVFIWVALAVVAAVLGCSNAHRTPLAPAPGETKVPDECIRDFTCGGRPIHPKLLQMFEGWLSDGGPVVISVDVANTVGTDQFHEPVAETANRLIYYNDESQQGAWYGYRRLVGALGDGTQVVRTFECGGGTGVFEDLLFLRFSRPVASGWNGRPLQRVILTLVDQYDLGDRDDCQITVDADRVIVGTSRYRDAPVVLSLPR